MVVSSRDAISLALTHAIPQLIRLGCILGCQTGLIQIEIREAQACVRQSKIRIEVNRTLKERNRFGIALPATGSAPHAVSLQGFERRSGGFHRYIEFLHSDQRFTELPPQVLGCPSQRLEDILLAGRLSLFGG
jgi:hypothetical protein